MTGIEEGDRDGPYPVVNREEGRMADGSRRGGGRRGWRMRARVRVWARQRWSLLLLFGFTVVEAVVFPAPTEALLVALVVARRGRAGALAALATVGSATGGALGYLVGRRLFDPVVSPLLELYGAEGAFQALGGVYANNLAIALVTSGYTPVPYLLYALSAGAYGVPFWSFLGWSIAGRGLKYALLCLLAYLGAPAIWAVARRYGGWAAAIGAAVLLLLWWSVGR